MKKNLLLYFIILITITGLVLTYVAKITLKEEVSKRHFLLAKKIQLKIQNLILHVIFR